MKKVNRLELENVSFAYEDETVVKSMSFHLEEGNHLSIIGASGCGKTTLLEIIYGLHIFQGEIKWLGEKLKGPEERLVPGEPFIKYVSQSFDLYPFHTAYENVGKHLKSMPYDEKEERIQELLAMVEMEDYADTKAKFLSGGQQQRIALVQALAEEPELLLLDEPFSHIDQYRKNALRRNIFNYLKEKNITCIVATHDPTEVLSYSDKTLVMKDGEVLQKDTPQNLYNNPQSLYVATLFGEVSKLPASAIWPGKAASKDIILYPHELYLAKASDFQVVVSGSYFCGSYYLIESVYEGNKVFFNHFEALKDKMTVCLAADFEQLKHRLN
ncbi:ABC transporter ATP-binding protein [Fulvivirga ligni]|uniref:ABC transporter ATP-binding protein n=1 Tax=Fulvivirga ligni TaxID=2904246 RepID=UPI001F4837E1|nr:ABC transporter ATP-binding protein [Fulvivirga ligni]UII22143.1 ABC transporter ATP-binding protein [Fulvivirga ligni]